LQSAHPPPRPPPPPPPRPPANYSPRPAHEMQGKVPPAFTMPVGKMLGILKRTEQTKRCGFFSKEVRRIVVLGKNQKSPAHAGGGGGKTVGENPAEIFLLKVAGARPPWEFVLTTFCAGPAGVFCCLLSLFPSLGPPLPPFPAVKGPPLPPTKSPASPIAFCPGAPQTMGKGVPFQWFSQLCGPFLLLAPKGGFREKVNNSTVSSKPQCYVPTVGPYTASSFPRL